ncbi:hypothetical protein GGF31_004754 [Allomyces arbusculus]|nr:hypothetical protein GGF31_004754 [Allomyces arbusculus]
MAQFAGSVSPRATCTLAVDIAVTLLTISFRVLTLPPPHAFSGPLSIAIDDRRAWVTDPRNQLGPITIDGSNTVAVAILALPSITQWKVAAPHRSALVTDTVAIAVQHDVTVPEPPSVSPELAFTAITVALRIALAFPVFAPARIALPLARVKPPAAQLPTYNAVPGSAAFKIALRASRTPQYGRWQAVLTDALNGLGVITEVVLDPTTLRGHVVMVAIWEQVRGHDLAAHRWPQLEGSRRCPDRGPAIFLLALSPFSFSMYAIDEGLVDFMGHVLLPLKTTVHAHLTTGFHFPSALVLDRLRINGFPGPIWLVPIVDAVAFFA